MTLRECKMIEFGNLACVSNNCCILVDVTLSQSSENGSHEFHYFIQSSKNGSHEFSYFIHAPVIGTYHPTSWNA
jgi:hypothetical protein